MRKEERKEVCIMRLLLSFYDARGDGSGLGY